MTNKFATASGWILVLLGVMGLFGISVVGDDASSLFVVGTAMSLVHLFLGFLLMYVAYMVHERSGKTLRVIGGVLVALSVLGFFFEEVVLGFVLTNSNTDYLHLVLGLVFLWASMSKNSHPSEPLPMGTM